MDLTPGAGAASAGGSGRQSRGFLQLALAAIIFLLPLLMLPSALAARRDGWREVGLRGQEVLALALASVEGERVLYAETRSGVWRHTTLSGWRRIDAGLPTGALGQPALAAWRLVTGRPWQIYALTGVGTARQLYHSDSGGNGWRLVGPAPGQVERPAMVVWPGLGGSGDVIVLETASRMQRSTDGGASWSPAGPWPDAEGCGDSGQEFTRSDGESSPLLTAVGDPINPNRVYGLSLSGDFWSSDSGGLAWTQSCARSDARGDGLVGPVWNLAVVPHFGVRLWASGSGRIFSSTDGGEHWASHLLPGSAERGIPLLATDPRAPETVFVAVPTSGVYRSDDAGATWSGLGLPASSDLHSLVLDPDSRNVLYAATGDGIWALSVTARPPSTGAPITVAPSDGEVTVFPVSTPTVVVAPSPSPSPIPSWTPAEAPTGTSTPTAVAAALATSTSTAVPTSTGEPTATPSSSPTATLVPTSEPTAAPPRQEPLPQPTVVPPSPVPVPPTSVPPTAAPATRAPLPTPPPR